MAEIELHLKASTIAYQAGYNDGANDAPIVDPPWHKTVANQWLLLMKKNIILSTRSKFMAIFQLISPILFMLVLFGVNTYVNDAIGNTPENGRVINPTPSVVGLIPRCYGQINNPSLQCITIAYTPINSVTDLLVSRVAARNNIPDEEIMGFESAYALDDFILANENRTQAAYVFLSWGNGTFEYALQYNDSVVCTNGIANTCRNPRIGVAIPMATSMDREIMNLQLSNDRSTNVLTSYQVSLMQFPQPRQTYDSGIVPIFLLAAIMFNFVILAKTLVQEKETRLLEGMKMMGLLELPYWSSWFIHYTVIMLLCVFMLFVSGYIFDFLLFTNNDFGVVFFTLFLFGLSMICMAFLLTSFMTNSQNTATVGFILWIVFCAVFITINTSLYVEDDSVSGTVQDIVSLISPFAFSKGISVLNNAAQADSNGVSWARRGDYAFARYWPATRVWNFLILDSFIYLILGWWITNVFPGDFGVPKPFYFFLTRTYWLGSSGKGNNSKKKNVKKIKIDDEDVIKEEERVNTGNHLPDTVVIVDDLIKIYGRGKRQFIANKGISFTMQNNQLFCLLGPNGAGKTTLFNMLTGLFPSSGGDASIFGYSINAEMDKIRRLMGVCPQHDLLWGDLSGRQHLDFFCRFKNMSKDSIEAEIEKRLAEVGLTDIADVPTSAYSGGEKRRLSVALAITGNPKIVFLDEPTTGMDPVSRHQVWEIISRAKANRVVVLTTHSMEEADHLSDRIAIVAHGQLRCLGTNIHLKHKFGVGYQLSLFFNPADDISMKQTINQHLQDNLTMWAQYVSEVNGPGTLTLRIPHDMTEEIPALLQNLEENSAKLGINEISMNLSSLEEVFLKIASETLTETSISLTDISTSNEELAKMVANRKTSHMEETPFKQQIEALGKKTISGYIHNWKSLVFQFGIAILLVLIMLALGAPSSVSTTDNPHPPIVPPVFMRFNGLKTEIPYYVANSNVAMGACCASRSGFLGNMDFSVLNNSEAQASLGKFVPSEAFTFTPYNSADAMYQRIYREPTNWATGYYFEQISMSSMSVRIFQNVSETYATLGWVNLLSNAYFREITNQNNSILTRVKAFPTRARTVKVIETASEATWVVLGSSFIMVMVLSSIVREKKERQRYLMQMAGMRMSAYWLVMFGINLVIYWVYLFFYYGFSAAALLRIFTLSSPRILAAMYIVWAFNQIGLAFLLSSFASDPHTATLATYIYIVALVIATSYINPVFVDTSVVTKSSVLYGTAVIPHIAYGRMVSALVFYYYTDYVGMTWELFTQLPYIKHMLTILFGIGVGFYILHQYSERVFPSEFRQSLPPHFFVLPSFWRKNTKEIKVVEPKLKEPEDVGAERTAACNYQDLPLRVPGVTKIFRGDKQKVVVDNLALTVGKTECLALIGPNGSGKTTFINVISGLYPVTSGDAIINGSSIVSNIQNAQRYMGVCPQDSVLYNELTGREHLLLFGRLRNLQGEELEQAVDLALKQVLLTDAQHRQAGGYSGGMKRRLSLAISLIGNPPVVMLDEPTTGVDPFSRRVVWDVIQSYKKYSSVLLVTHSMEEAESLADRVAMVSEGSLRCVGRPMELKERYGVGYNLTIMHTGSTEQLISFVKGLVPSGKVLQVVGNSCIFFSLPKNEVKLSVLFSEIQRSKENLRITDWGILQSSLEDVLLQAIGVFTTEEK